MALGAHGDLMVDSHGPEICCAPMPKLNRDDGNNTGTHGAEMAHQIARGTKLATLRRGAVNVECQLCKNTGRISVLDLIESRGEDADLADAVAAMRCSVCRSERRPDISISMDGGVSPFDQLDKNYGDVT
jgi:hypothetical protein